jgi:ATP-dependent Lhr-like helicase
MPDKIRMATEELITVPKGGTGESPAARVEAWFAARGWEIFSFQREVWDAFARGESGLLHCTTGAGKTYAVWFAALRDALAEPGAGLQVLWITPLRALAADTEAALAAPLEELGLSWTVARRTGDTSSHQRRKILERPPHGLVTTPESLALLLSQPAFLPHFTSLRLVVVDEWHELLSTKRGVLTELGLARLRSLAPAAPVWGLSATLGNTEEAAAALGGVSRPMRIIRGRTPKRVQIETLLPPADRHFPWGGHLGLHLLPQVAKRLRANRTSIVFTNTRSQAELWYRALVEAMPDIPLGLHHGSLSDEVRHAAEEGLRTGSLRAVVATSSLDLGVDFAPVDGVFQIGSPKGVARLLQRAGRSGHQPGADSAIFCVPANTFELVEIAAARDLAAAGTVESRAPLRAPLDVLCQHIVTVAAAGGFRADALFREVRTSHAYRDLAEDEWRWALEFAATGGETLRAYPEFARLVQTDGLYAPREERVAKQHRMNIGTITSDASVTVAFQNGARLGSIEESFIAKLRPGDRFLFGGRNLELVRVRDLRAIVRLGGKRPTTVPRWMGGKMPLSSCLSLGVRRRLDAVERNAPADTEEMRRLAPILAVQKRLSRVPAAGELLIERLRTREGHHIFFYPLEGRLVHEGLAALFAFRIARREPLTFSLAVNDYGFELLSAKPAPLEDALTGGLFAEENLLADILGSIHSAEMARRRFREIARVAGLVNEGVGRARKSARQLTISSSLLYDVFARYDPGNRLLAQATHEVMESELEQTRLRETLAQLRERALVIVDAEAPTPFAYPLFVARFREQLSTEELATRVSRMEAAMEKVVAS